MLDLALSAVFLQRYDGNYMTFYYLINALSILTTIPTPLIITAIRPKSTSRHIVSTGQASSILGSKMSTVEMTVLRPGAYASNIRPRA